MNKTNLVAGEASVSPVTKARLKRALTRLHGPTPPKTKLILMLGVLRQVIALVVASGRQGRTQRSKIKIIMMLGVTPKRKERPTRPKTKIRLMLGVEYSK